MFRRRRQIGPQKALRSLQKQGKVARILRNAAGVGLATGFIGLARGHPASNLLWIPFPLMVASERIDLRVLKKTIGRPALAKRLAQKSSGLNRYYFEFIACLGVIPKNKRAPFLKAVNKLTIFRLTPFSAPNLFGKAVFDAYLETNFKQLPLFKKSMELAFEEMKKAGAREIEISDNLISNFAGYPAGKAAEIESVLAQNGEYEISFPPHAPVSSILVRKTSRGWQIRRVDNP